jgi:hypothetical protein
MTKMRAFQSSGYASPRFDAAGRIVHTSVGRRLLGDYTDARDGAGHKANTLTALARQTHTTVAALSLLVNGHTKEPSLSLAIALRNLIGIPVDAWIEP